MYYFEGLETDSSAGHLDDPRGEAPMSASSPMIIKMKKLIPHQRANTRDPEIRNPALKGGEGGHHGLMDTKVFTRSVCFTNKSLIAEDIKIDQRYI